MPPQFTSLLHAQEVKDGDRAEFICEVTGSPKPSVTWMKNNKILKNCSDFKQTYDGKVAKLVIEEALMEDTGDYCVTASNSQGEDSVMASLTVLGNQLEIFSLILTLKLILTAFAT